MTPASQNSDFFERVQAVVARIPYGKVTTYGHIAKALGMASSARMVGWALNGVNLTQREHLPCHRVVNRFGALSGAMHFETPFAMRERLESEGIPFDGDNVDLEKCLWDPGVDSEY